MTIGEFKKWLEDNGVPDEAELRVDSHEFDNDYLEPEFHADNNVWIVD